ncbi:UDP-N-acetylmuramate dehydrogenase [Patescibacteria group bacterium]|nr:UDP-N-acetylmuramate dehydrogenase [Patescibacteria group bacterium]
MMKVLEDIDLKPYTIFKIGGRARYFCEVDSSQEFKEAIRWAGKNNLQLFILGIGSNVLISDEGFSGLVIKNKLENIKIKNTDVYIGAGAPMARVVVETTKAGLSGFEWAIGIPGTIGGSIRGNAGCFGFETKDVLESVDVFDINKNTKYKIQNRNCNFGYRDSIFKHSPNLIIFSALLKLRKGNLQKSQEKISEYSKTRVASQDIGAQCAGCIFKNVLWSRRDLNKTDLIKKFPELKKFSNQKEIPVAFLIDDLGLKGTKIGNAQISRRHANYFINLGNARAQDVIMLIGLTKERIQNHYGILLEEEIHHISS